ncbi:unnamed protein product [Fusarium equiseti]|uniref:Uncharacterized protein n=1 Tax=Fusarium equiseti TaxID=61235 RepID=A0A8J2IYA2_FUSEQ|nr:unnamed protein product [Fusarium equiseti]
MQISRDHPILLQIIEMLQRRYWYTHCHWARLLRDLQHERRNATNETRTESAVVQLAQQSYDNDTRLIPNGTHLNLLLRQFGIDTEALPNPENRADLDWWPNTFRDSSHRKRLDPMVFQLFDDIYRLLELQRDEQDRHVRGRDYRIFDRMARLTRLDGNEALLESITPLAESLRSEGENMCEGTTLTLNAVLEEE